MRIRVCATSACISGASRMSAIRIVPFAESAQVSSSQKNGSRLFTTRGLKAGVYVIGLHVTAGAVSSSSVVVIQLRADFN